MTKYYYDKKTKALMSDNMGIEPSVFECQGFDFFKFEDVRDDINLTDLIEVDGVIQLDEAKYHATRNTQQIELLRAKRAPLLHAFDAYRSSVVYGSITETAEEHEAVHAWYQRLLDLDAEAIDNVPPAVSYYLK